MKVIEHIAQASKTLFSFEILPPLKGSSIQSLFNAIDPLMEFKPSFIDVTYHREEHAYRNHDNGLLEKYITRKRPGTVGICAAVMNRYKVDTVPHIICGGFSKQETEEALIDLNFLGIENALLLRGDSSKNEARFTPHPEGHHYATDLIEQVNQLNAGKFLDDDIKDPTPMNFCIGVAGYPEKHFEAPNMACDLRYLKKKVELGAEFIVTQMFFDNQKYFSFVEQCREAGIDIPIIPGLKPLTAPTQLTVLPSVFHLDLPEELVKTIEACDGNKEAIRQVGIEWCTAQSRELIAYGVPCLHYYSMGRSYAVKKVAEAVY